MFIHIYFVILLKDQELDDCISNKLHVFHSSFNDNLSEKNSQSFSIDAYATMNKLANNTSNSLSVKDINENAENQKTVNANSIKQSFTKSSSKVLKSPNIVQNKENNKILCACTRG
ncbi:uncharacterized protein LOC116416246 isoform X1 [Nasonia vitripennis]|uniref:Uncharacterized protein n=1 Tax=Nasonia vitripennis TaxID=7425 RepID=A0A7M7T7D5_NASVI|nr:uncharacterized protein LOC116416246 isoform X1 [Nasonia vitripennis]